MRRNSNGSRRNSIGSKESAGHYSTDSQSSQSVGQAPQKRRGSKEDKLERRKMEQINRQLASLQLPNMPSIVSPIHQRRRQEPTNSVIPPKLRILVVADIDLESSSALAEAALVNHDPTKENPLQLVDLCIACGPFCGSDGLNDYYQGRHRLRHFQKHHDMNRHLFAQGRTPTTFAPPPTITTPFSAPKPSNYIQNDNNRKQNTRSPEENAAMEGLMTATLSQLESIVCRVVFIPGNTDPIALPNKQNKRLTPNSRNLHKQWMPLGPGLGCAGLLHLDWERQQQQMKQRQQEEEEDDTNHRSSNSLAPPLENNNTITPLSPRDLAKQYRKDYCESLKDLVQMAPPLSAVTEMQPSKYTYAASIDGLQQTSLFQSILVTYYHHYQGSQEEADDNEETSEEVESFDPPWPLEHEAFCALPIVQEHVLLEIAAGRNSKGESVSKMQVPKGPNMNVILPGSLRERGDYCLVDIAFMQVDNGYQWRVQHTQFLNLPNM